MGEFIERLKNLIIGIFVGAFSILPGISAAVIAAIFGVYERMVEDLGNLRAKLRPEFWFLVTLAVGLIIGAVAFSLFYKKLVEPWEFYYVVIAMFIGMIVGQLPDVYEIARSRGDPIRKAHIVWFVIGFAAMMAIVTFQITYGISDAVWDGSRTAMILMFIVGLIFAVGGLIPGFAAPTLLLAIGLFGMMTEVLSFSDMNLKMFLIFAAGVVIGVLGFSKIMDWTLKNYHSLTYFAVLGLVVGSIFTITSKLKPATESLGNFTLCVVAGVVGFALSLGISYIGRKQRARAHPV